MKKIKFFIDGCASDLNSALISSYNLNILYNRITFNNKDYYSDCNWIKTPKKEYLDFLHEGNYARISQVSMGEWKNIFEEALKEENDILFLSLSKRFCGSYKNAFIAKNLLIKNYPEREFEIIDSELAGAGYKLLALKIAEELQKNNLGTLKNFSEYIQNKYSKKIQTYWICNNLNYVVFMSRGSDAFEANEIPPGSPLMATDFQGSFSVASINSSVEKTFEDFLKKVKEVKSWELSYSPDLREDFISSKVQILTENLGKSSEHVISYQSPTNIAIAGPYSYSVGVLR